MNAQVRIAVIIPAGPRDDIIDTLSSVVRYTDPSRIIVLVDDGSILSRNKSCVHELPEDIVVLKAPPGRGGVLGGLWVKESMAYRLVLEEFRPDILLRLDADAVMLGSGIEDAAMQIFDRDPDVGLLGSYRVGPDGGVRDFSPASAELRTEIGLRGLIHPRRRKGLRHLVQVAREHGYTDGEHVLGAASIHSYQAAKRIYDNDWFDLPWMKTSRLGDDHMMALLTVAAGFRIYDFGGPGDPLALKWRGLPSHPQDLLAAGKLITHSVRSWEGLTEPEIRAMFAQARLPAPY